ncbi:hypothetical protein G6F31_021225 [Rhizopus arrhizus]|nr:hypothetical protein G6F31_021225 [Rhizopus arrhizus]
MCAPFSAARISSRAVSADARPCSGLAPAPRPVRPRRICTGALVAASACASVFAQMKSTPCTPLRIMCATALPPAPPTPTTLITVPLVLFSSISKFIMMTPSQVRFCKSQKFPNSLSFVNRLKADADYIGPPRV